MAKFYRRRFKRYQKRNAERVVRGGISTIGTGTQQIAYTFTAREACLARSIKLDVGVTTPGVQLAFLMFWFWSKKDIMQTPLRIPQ